VRPGVSYGDIVAGLYTAIGILSALHERERSGRGQAIDISMLDCQVSILENAIARYHVTGEAPQPIGTRHPSATPFQAFPTADGYIVIALAPGAVDQWPLFCGVLAVPELIDDPRFNTGPKRTANHAVLEPLLEAALVRHTTADWLEELLAVDIPCGPIMNVGQVADDPQVRHRGMIREVTHRTAGALPIANTPVRMSRSESGIKGPPPDFGEHTAEILRSFLGLDADAINDLSRRGIVATEGGPDVESLLL
jgi:CoA:oxalate CoA-transferase